MLSEEELFEARSMRYVDAARVVYLAPGPERPFGKFVVFSMTRGDAVGSFELKGDPGSAGELRDLLVEACARSAEFWAASRDAERQGATVQVAASATELGL